MSINVKSKNQKNAEINKQCTNYKLPLKLHLQVKTTPGDIFTCISRHSIIQVVPITGLGRLVGAVCAIFGILVIALPIPIIGNQFSRWEISPSIYHTGLEQCLRSEVQSLKPFPTTSFFLSICLNIPFLPNIQISALLMGLKVSLIKHQIER